MPEGKADVLIAPVVVVDAIGAVVAAAIGSCRQLQNGGELRLHQVAPHLIRTIGQPTRVAVIDRAQQEGRGVHRTGSQHHNMGLEQPVLASDTSLHALDLAATGIHMQPRDSSTTTQLHR